MADEPWYQDGLRFECTQCGDCCTGAPGYVWVTDAELQAIADHRGEPVEQVRALYSRKEWKRTTLRERENGDCVFWQRGVGCTVYEARPTQCRTWPFWHSNMRSPADWQQTAEKCPGCDRGGLIPVEEITRRIRAVKV